MNLRSDISKDLALAEASAWLVRLQSSERTPAYEAAFRTWLAEDPAHARAFARVTDTWDIIPGAARKPSTPERAPRRRGRLRLLAVAASAAVLAVTATLALPGLRDPTYQTGVGEQRVVMLDDGTRVTLNTNTQLSVNYGRNLRRISLQHGEAMFEVAKNRRRPFVVEAGGEQVRALGTTFVVRNESDRFDVLLIEGRVQVSQNTGTRRVATRISPMVLKPGERLAIRERASKLTLDRPQVEEMTAWRRGEAMFDNATLAGAVAEINRYGTTQVHVDDPSLASLRISGVFATHDPVEFANVIAKLHDLSVVRTKDGVVLKAGPSSH